MRQTSVLILCVASLLMCYGCKNNEENEKVGSDADAVIHRVIPFAQSFTMSGDFDTLGATVAGAVTIEVNGQPAVVTGPVGNIYSWTVTDAPAGAVYYNYEVSIFVDGNYVKSTIYSLNRD